MVCYTYAVVLTVLYLHLYYKAPDLSTVGCEEDFYSINVCCYLEIKQIKFFYRSTVSY